MAQVMKFEIVWKECRGNTGEREYREFENLSLVDTLSYAVYMLLIKSTKFSENGVWILENNDFFYTTKENALKLKQIERDCPEV